MARRRLTCDFDIGENFDRPFVSCNFDDPQFSPFASMHLFRPSSPAPFSAPMKKAPGRFAAPWINLPHTLSLMNSETRAPTLAREESLVSQRTMTLSSSSLLKHHRRPASASVTVLALERCFMQRHATLYKDKANRKSEDRASIHFAVGDFTTCFKVSSRERSELIGALINTMRQRFCKITK